MKLIRNTHTKKIHIASIDLAKCHTKCGMPVKHWEFVTVVDFPYVDYQDVGRDGEMYCSKCGTIADFCNVQTPYSVDTRTNQRISPPRWGS